MSETPTSGYRADGLNYLYTPPTLAELRHIAVVLKELDDGSVTQRSARILGALEILKRRGAYMDNPLEEAVRYVSQALQWLDDADAEKAFPYTVNGAVDSLHGALAALSWATNAIYTCSGVVSRKTRESPGEASCPICDWGLE